MKLPVNEVDMTAVKFTPQKIQAPHLTGFWLKLFVMLVETPIIGSMILTLLKNMNRGAERQNLVFLAWKKMGNLKNALS